MLLTNLLTSFGCLLKFLMFNFSHFFLQLMIKLHKEEHIIEVHHLGILIEYLLSEILVFNTKTLYVKPSTFELREIGKTEP